MNSTSELKQHLQSVMQTRQITNTMYLLSTSRLKKAMQSIDYNVNYMKLLRNSVGGVLNISKGEGFKNRYLDKNPKGTALFLSVMGDKGLCGSYNSDVARLTVEVMKEKKNPFLLCFGMVGMEKLACFGVKPDEVLPGSSMHPSLTLAHEIAEKLCEMYLTDKINEVYVVYTPYTHGERKPVKLRLLPLLRHDFTDIEPGEHFHEGLIFEPSQQEVFEHMVPLYCAGLIYEILMQSCASENAARMEAMQAASNSADEMIGKLRSELNAARQLSITNEITEIAAAADVQGAV